LTYRDCTYALAYQSRVQPQTLPAMSEWPKAPSPAGESSPTTFVPGVTAEGSVHPLKAARAQSSVELVEGLEHG
jgi:hypothetical protein